MRHLIRIFLLLANLSLFAQLPFEKYKAFPMKAHPFHAGSSVSGSSYNLTTVFKFQNKEFRVQLSTENNKIGSNMLIYCNNQLFGAFSEPLDMLPITAPDSLYIADIDNNGLIDLKIIIPNNGCGLAAQLNRKIYLMACKDGGFDKVSFMDFADEHEKDLNNDGKPETIELEHLTYSNHSYWVYHLFHFVSGKPICVDYQFGYPLVYRHLNDPEIYKRVNLPAKVITPHLRDLSIQHWNTYKK